MPKKTLLSAHELVGKGLAGVMRNEVGQIFCVYCPKCDNALEREGFARKIDENDAWDGSDERYYPCDCSLS